MKSFMINTLVAGIFTLSITANAHADFFGKNSKINAWRECRRTHLVEFDGTIAEAAIANPFDNLGTLLEAVQAADPSVVEALADESNHLTLLAPTDNAFAAVPIINDILADQSLLTNVLLYHVLDGGFDPRRTRIFRSKMKESLLTQKLFFYWGYDTPKVNQSHIECQGVKTTNGYIWIINSVLLPQFLTVD